MEETDNTTLSNSNQNNTNVNNEGETLFFLNVHDVKMECEYDEPDKVYIRQTIISEHDIKQEPCDTIDAVENSIVHLPEIVNCNFIKQEEELVTNDTEASIVDDKVIIQETVFLNNFKRETNEASGNLCCGKCNEEYELYCTRCSMLIRILDTRVSEDVENRSKNTLPKDILDIRETFLEVGVYALMPIPEDVIFGPFEGLDSVPSTTGSTWKLKGGKLVYPENLERLNWMRYVKYAPQSSDQNLLVFQYQDCLYFRSTRKIMEGEELLVYYCEEQANNLGDEESETYLHPIVAKEFKDVYACTYCCLGYDLEEDLVNHKFRGCFNIHTETHIEGIVQCSLCKMYMDKKELSEYHMKYCWEKNSSLSQSMPIANQEADFFPRIRKKSASKQFKCGICTIFAPCNRHKKNRRFAETQLQCSLCDEVFTQLENLEGHLKLAHPSSKPNKSFTCPKCSYKTISKKSLDKHLKTHDNAKQFECGTCKKHFRLNSTLQRHLLYFHAEVKVVRQPKKYTCVKCPYETDAKKCLVKHYNTHSEDRPFTCEVCFRGFTSMASLDVHVKHIHPEDNVKRYRCHVCGYETDYKSRLKEHFRIHEDRLKFKCELCGKEFNQKSNVKVHIKTVHGESKEFKCSKCNYETNRKDSYIKHTLTHDSGIRFTCKICNLGFACRAEVKLHDQEYHSSPNDTKELLEDDKKHIENIKQFQCKLCPKQFHQKGILIKHIKDTHEEKTITCSRPNCSYKTNRRANLRRHVLVHDKIQKFKCSICKAGFTNAGPLNVHIKRKHPIKKEKIEEIMV